MVQVDERENKIAGSAQRVKVSCVVRHLAESDNAEPEHGQHAALAARSRLLRRETLNTSILCELRVGGHQMALCGSSATARCCRDSKQARTYRRVTAAVILRYFRPATDSVCSAMFHVAAGVAVSCATLMIVYILAASVTQADLERRSIRHMLR